MGKIAGGTLSSVYKKRIGEPSTDDEVYGYWIFIAGALIGLIGILGFLVGRPASPVRQWAIVGASAGLAMAFAGQNIRLPIRHTATKLVYIGLAICAAAILWFIAAFPDQWGVQTGHPLIISLYLVGMLVIAAGAVFVPISTRRDRLKAQAESRNTELNDLREKLRKSEANEADLELAVDQLQKSLEEAETNEADLARGVNQLQTALEESEDRKGDLEKDLMSQRASQSRFEIYEDRGGEWRWRLRHRNGNIIASSGEGYTQRHNVENGMQAVRRDALGAPLLLFESEETLPDEDEEFDPVEEMESRATFELYEDRGEEWRWRLRHDNGNIIADGGEGYVSKDGAETAIDRIRTYAAPADYLRPDPSAFEVYLDQAGEWRWHLIHRNGNVLANSGRAYSSRSNTRRALETIRDSVDEMELETYEDDAGEYRWQLKNDNGRIMAHSSKGYESRRNVEDAVQRFRKFVPDADFLEILQATFEVYEDRSGKFRWRLRHRNGNIIADSGQGYSNRSGAFDGIESVKRNASNAEITRE